ncbi:MAG: MaoC/PaaZ C-terminal domain-containing protein [Sulfuricaulis sp.]|nr:MaoC/PaaZ C-terminal domain-containing protein [Sulfuricaulis sp.]
MPNEPINARRLRDWIFPEVVQTYTARDTMLYALALGFGADPGDRQQLRHVYEKDLLAFPTMAVTLGFDGPWTVPESGIDLTHVLHGEQSITLHRALPAAATVRSRERITDLIDKGKDAIIHSQRQLIDEAGACIATLESALYCRGNGGFGGASEPMHQMTQPVPARVPDAVVDMPTLPQTALLYRLSGDYALLHADPDFARSGGFERPIMHGLCTFGIAAHALVKGCANYDAGRLKSFQARFCAPAFPGETIRVELWRDGALVSLRAWVKERGVKVLDRGQAVLA